MVGLVTLEPADQLNSVGVNTMQASVDGKPALIYLDPSLVTWIRESGVVGVDLSTIEAAAAVKYAAGEWSETEQDTADGPTIIHVHLNAGDLPAG